jgi:carboxynorspermidine decarboxylase
VSLSFDPNEVPTPAYVLDLRLLEDNLRILSGVQSAAGCRILLALKAFALWKAFPMVGRYLAGASASSLSEARLASEYLGGELHVCAPAYPPKDFPEILTLADHVVFNSLRQ